MLYHISLKCWERIEIFSPRIPRGCLNGVEENDTIPRICLSDSLDNCLTAVSWGGLNLIKDPPYKGNNFLAVARLYEFDKENIKKENLLMPYQIAEYVPDSLISNEYWVINQNIFPEKSSIIVLRDFFFDVETMEYKGKNR